MLELDGSAGEGGGQLLRSALAVSAATSRPFRISRIRASRDPPGLRSQHLTAARAAAEVCGATLDGDHMGSEELQFRPGALRPGRHRFDTGGAGSAVLVLQTVLPPLLRADAESVVDVRGGTHNPMAPPYDFLEQTLLPFLNREATRVETELLSPGFYPAGGGRIRMRVCPGPDPAPLDLTDRAPILRRRVRALVSDLPRHIGEREVSTAHAFLDLRPDAMEVREIDDPRGPGNVVMIEVEMSSHAEVFTGFGRRGVPAEEVAKEACREADAYLRSDAPVGRRLADQLLVPLALEGGGVYRTTELTSHTRTNAALLGECLGIGIDLEDGDVGSTVRIQP